MWYWLHPPLVILSSFLARYGLAKARGADAVSFWIDDAITVTKAGSSREEGLREQPCTGPRAFPEEAVHLNTSRRDHCL